jgi:hypothetical protein
MHELEVVPFQYACVEQSGCSKKKRPVQGLMQCICIASFKYFTRTCMLTIDNRNLSWQHVDACTRRDST